jgi:hypothetical protein
MRVEFRLVQAGVEYDLATSIVNVIFAEFLPEKLPW